MRPRSVNFRQIFFLRRDETNTRRNRSRRNEKKIVFDVEINFLIDRRARGRRARRAGRLLGGSSTIRQIAVGGSVRTEHRAVRKGLQPDAGAIRRLRIQ